MWKEGHTKMIIYVPIYQDGRHPLTHIDTEKAHYHKFPQRDAIIFYYGACYNGEALFTAPEGVEAYWRRDSRGMASYRIKASDQKITWQRRSPVSAP